VVLAPYLLVCWAVAFGVLPALALGRRLRRQPDVQRCARTRRVDIAAELGHKPVDRGRHCFLARLPGNEIFQVDFTERTLCLPGLPSAWDGLSVLHLSGKEMAAAVPLLGLLDIDQSEIGFVAAVSRLPAPYLVFASPCRCRTLSTPFLLPGASIRP